MTAATGKLLAVSDLHVGHPGNREVLEAIRPTSDEDWLIVAGDVGELVADVEWALGVLSRRFARVIWAPGNHELWTPPGDAVRLRGERRYRHLVEICRGLGVLTPEDPYAVWAGRSGPVRVAPLFVLYDYSFRDDDLADCTRALDLAYQRGVVCTDEFLLHPDPYPSRQAWCESRLDISRGRLESGDTHLPSVLVNHFPLYRGSTRILRHQDFALWCGTVHTNDWHLRYRAQAVVYGHLHIPRTTFHDGVRFEEVSIGYPREWQRRGDRVPPIRQILPGLDGDDD
jgi:3',5'-cyclic AMP phosphodiesterase CpdA